MKKFLLVIAVMCLVVPAMGQTPSMTHIFPQVADGTFGSNIIYDSILYVINLTQATANCSFNLYGMSVSRLVTQPPFVIPAQSTFLTSTRGTDSLATGYGSLSCSEPVYASLIYLQGRPDSTIDGMATVFSAPAVRYAALPMLIEGKYFRYGYAIANNNDNPMKVSIVFSINGQSVSKILPVPARTKISGYVDEQLSLPSSGLGNLEFVSQSGMQFSVTALLFASSTFTTLIPGY
jgi:hypothetical protein